MILLFPLLIPLVIFNQAKDDLFKPRKFKPKPVYKMQSSRPRPRHRGLK